MRTHEAHRLDPNKEITAVYADKPLKSILAEILPGVPFKFEGVDGNVTVNEMTVAKTPLEKVCEYLDLAAGVSFRFDDRGLTISERPVVPGAP